MTTNAVNPADRLAPTPIFDALLAEYAFPWLQETFGDGVGEPETSVPAQGRTRAGSDTAPPDPVPSAVVAPAQGTLVNRP